MNLVLERNFIHITFSGKAGLIMAEQDNETYKMLEQIIREQQGIDPKLSLAEASKQAGYDYGGFIKAVMAGDSRAEASVNPADGRIHFPDPWKAEEHGTIKWKTREDYNTQAKYSGMSDKAMSNGLVAMSSNNPIYQRAIQLEQQVPMIGYDRDAQRMYTQYVFEQAKKDVANGIVGQRQPYRR